VCAAVGSELLDEFADELPDEAEDVEDEAELDDEEEDSEFNEVVMADNDFADPDASPSFNRVLTGAALLEGTPSPQ